MSQQNLICSLHNLPCVLCDKTQLYCQICLQIKMGNDEFMTIEENMQKRKETINQCTIKVDKQITTLQNLMNQIYKFKTSVETFTEKFISQISNYIDDFNAQKIKITDILQLNITFNQLEERCECVILQNFEKARKFLQERQLDFYQNCSTHEINEAISKICQEPNAIIEKDKQDYMISLYSEISPNQKYFLQLQEDNSSQQTNRYSIFQSSIYSSQQNQIQLLKVSKNNSYDQEYFCPKQLVEDNSKFRSQTVYNINEMNSPQKEFEKLETCSMLYLNKMFKYKKFIYEKSSQITIQEIEQNLVFLFNNDTTNLFIGQYNTIIVYQFDDGIIGRQFQKLKGHKDVVNCLALMSKQNLLVSGSSDKRIIIWSQDDKMCWKVALKLNDHSQIVLCVIANELENLLISGGGDKTIKFWKQQGQRWGQFWQGKQNWICQQTIITDIIIYSLSLNTSQTKLIANGSSATIFVFEQAYGKEWGLFQKIQVDEQGFRSCFTYDDQFVFQSKLKTYLNIFQFNHDKKCFEKSQQVEVQGYQESVGFIPCQFIISKGILMVKHGRFINFLTPFQNRQFKLEQSIEFTGDYIYGTLSLDAQYLVTQDQGSKEIQIRKLKYIE